MPRPTTITVIAALILVATTPFLQRAEAAIPPHAVTLAAFANKMPPPNTTKRRAWIVCHTFKHHCPVALRVAWCESSFRPWARDYASSTHWGMFQVSAALRRDYPGFAMNPWAQAKHALRIFNASKRNWDTHWRWSKHCWGT